MPEKIFSSPAGEIRLIVNNGFILYCNWEDPECGKKLEKVRRIIASHEIIKDSEEDSRILEEAEFQLLEYFAGRLTVFNLPIKLYGSLFQKKIWDKISEIPYGETISYGDLGIGSCGSASFSRALAQACSANPVAIIVPCHRVAGSHGKLGGYTGGLSRKRFLLELENSF